MIVSFCPGRIRLRFKELARNNALAALVRERVAAEPGVRKVDVNPLTGSVLIEYDTKLLPTAKLVEAGRRELARLNISLDIPGLP
jgi:copper chaperone CopZ